jgi:hypothetical protein
LNETDYDGLLVGEGLLRKVCCSEIEAEEKHRDIAEAVHLRLPLFEEIAATRLFGEVEEVVEKVNEGDADDGQDVKGDQ